MLDSFRINKQVREGCTVSNTFRGMRCWYWRKGITWVGSVSANGS
jgi:hypothetical protein